MPKINALRGIRGVMAALVLLLCAACSNGGGEEPSDAPAEAQPQGGGLTELGQQLPDRIQASRELRVGSDISYAPFEFYDALAPDVLERPAGEPEPTVRGVDYELAVLLGQKLGVRVSFVQVGFDDLLGELGAGRVDVVMSAMNATAERAKRATFLEYFRAGTSILVPKGNPKDISRLTDLCGRPVAYQEGTVQADIAGNLRSSCAADAQPRLLGFPSGTQAILAVKNGRAEACLTDFPVAAYNAKVSRKGNDFDVVGDPIDPAPYGIAIRKGNRELERPLRQALAAIVEDGGYDRVLARWGLTDGAVRNAGG
jgi:polar amino acid transport system substrate-binding protein